MNKYNIKKAYKGYKKIYNGNRYRAVKETIDDLEKLVDGSVIDDSFYEKYCELKKGNFICNTILDPMLISILTGLATGFAISLSDKGKLLGFLFYMLCASVLIIIIVFISSFSYVNSILRPYMLERMENKLKNNDKETENNKIRITSHSKYKCKYRIVFIPKCKRNMRKVVKRYRCNNTKVVRTKRNRNSRSRALHGQKF